MQVPQNGAVEPLPSGDLVFKPRTALQRFATSLRLLRALPWRRFKKGSVLTIEVRSIVFLSHIRPCMHQLCWSQSMS